MNKQNFSKFVIYLVIAFLPVTFCANAFAVGEDEEIEVLVKQAVAESPAEVPNKTIPVSNVTKSTETVKTLEEIPELKPEKKPRSILFKFAIAILWVVISSLIIYFSLISYKKFSGKDNFGIDVDENTLDAPKNFKEAVNLFLKKTRD